MRKLPHKYVHGACIHVCVWPIIRTFQIPYETLDRGLRGVSRFSLPIRRYAASSAILGLTIKSYICVTTER